MATTRIRRGARLHLYIAEWREHIGHGRPGGLSTEKLASQLDVDRTTMWRWETGRRRPTPGTQAQIAAALGIDPADLWRPPTGRQSLDSLAKDLPDRDFNAIADFVKRLTRAS